SIGLGSMADDPGTRVTHVRHLLMHIFAVLKKRKETETNPQKKIVVEVDGDLTIESLELPGSAWLVPEGTGTMAIFGMPEGKVQWSDFLNRAKDKYRYAWKDVIETVVLSSLDRLDVDNSQVVISHNEKDIYRVVLSRSIKYYDGRREFHLYFV